ncbi:flagellar hook-basal body protein [Gottschalkia acidurici]|nr:flagellar hook-basal body protein [Gottschalkia acidurici]
MNNSMYIATTSMITNQKTTDITSNNLANANTTGFKRDMPIIESFPEVLLAKIKDKDDLDNHVPFTGVKIEESEDGVYSLSINSGYFRLSTPAGMSHNREIEFTIDQNGYLKTFYTDIDGNRRTNDENYLLGRNGKPIRVEGQDIQISPNGNIISNGQVVDNILFLPSHQIIGTTSAGVRLDKVITDFTDGSYIKTGNDLDFAIKGQGFFKVQSQDGQIYYTRDGSFTINNEGTLMTKDGKIVLGQDGPIQLQGNEIELHENGSIFSNGQLIDMLNIVQVNNKEDLRKQGDNLYAAVENSQIQEAPFTGEVVNGYIEGSNVNVIKEMVNMITAFRNYESSQKIITTQDELLGKVVNDLGRV